MDGWRANALWITSISPQQPGLCLMPTPFRHHSGASPQRESCGPSGSIVMVSHPQLPEGTRCSQTVGHGCDQVQAIPGPEELISAMPQRSQRQSPSCASLQAWGAPLHSFAPRNMEKGPVQVPRWALLLLLLFLAAREQQKVLEEPPILSPQPSA